jgi:hypothetical protein
MRFFQKPWFRRFTEKADITAESLREIAAQLDEGHFDANLGGHVYKHRLAKKGHGKSGGYRILLFFKKDERVFFVYAFSKSQRANITQHEKTVLKAEAAILMGLTDSELDTLVKQCEFYEFT